MLVSVVYDPGSATSAVAKVEGAEHSRPGPTRTDTATVDHPEGHLAPMVLRPDLRVGLVGA
jgi:hypothetical protein